MGKLSDSIIAEFYREVVKDKYPHISFEHAKEMINLPFKFLAESLKGERLSTHFFPYIGRFKIRKYKAKVLCSMYPSWVGQDNGYNMTQEECDRITKLIKEAIDEE